MLAECSPDFTSYCGTLSALAEPLLGIVELKLCLENSLKKEHAETTCIRVLIECPKNDMATCLLLMLCVEMTHAVKHAC